MLYISPAKIRDIEKYFAELQRFFQVPFLHKKALILDAYPDVCYLIDNLKET